MKVTVTRVERIHVPAYEVDNGVAYLSCGHGISLGTHEDDNA